MNPQTVNVILATTIGLFILNGFFQGVIHMIGSLVGLLVGVALASRFDDAVGVWISSSFGWSPGVSTIVAFIIVLILVTRIFGWILDFIEKTFKILKLPLVGIMNRLVGAALGFVEGILVVGSTLLIVTSLPFPQFIASLNASTIAISLMGAAKILIPLLPKVLRDIYAGVPEGDASH